MLVLVHGDQESPTEERAYQDDADHVYAQSPCRLRVTAGTYPMNGCEGEDAQRQDVQTPPQCIANAGTQPGADANSNSQVQRHNPERHPDWTIMAREGNKDFVPAEVGEGVH